MRKTYWRKNERHLIENYELALADNFKDWICHHRLGLTLDCEFAHTSEELKRLGMYYDRPYFELLYIKRNEHTSMHNSAQSETTKSKKRETRKGYVATEETCLKISNSLKGKAPWNKGKTCIYSAETLEKMSKSNKGRHHTEEAKTNISTASTGRHHTEETKRKISEKQKGIPKPSSHRRMS